MVLLLGLAMCSGGGGDQRATGATSPASPTPTASSLVDPPATVTVPPGTAGGPALGPSSTSSGSASIPGPNSGTGSSGVGGGASAITPPKPCPDSAITLTVSSRQPSYPVGDPPVLMLTVRNIAKVTCLRDVGAWQEQILLYAGKTRLWSSNDCYPDGAKDVQALKPGQAITSMVVWSGLSSQPGCAGRRVRVPAGTYQLVGQLGTLTGKPGRLVLT